MQLLAGKKNLAAYKRITIIYDFKAVRDESMMLGKRANRPTMPLGAVSVRYRYRLYIVVTLA